MLCEVRKPHDYQKRGVEWLVGHGGAGLFADPGIGKTIIALRAFSALKKAGVAKRALVIAPLRVAADVWPNEGQEWHASEWKEIADLKITLLHGSKKEKLLGEKSDIFAINFEGLAWLFENGGYKQFRKLGIDTLIVDESSKVKNHRSKRFKMLKPILSSFARRWILTGSPNPNGYLDLFGQIFVIDLGKALSPYITHYRMNYFTPLDFQGWQWALKPGADKLIQKAVAPYVFRLDADDYLEMPEVVSNIIRVDLPTSARKIYEEMEDELFTRLKKGEAVTAANSGVAAMKCGQIANGGLFHDRVAENGLLQKRTWINLHDAKTDAVEEIVDELNGSPCIVAYDFEHDYDRLQKRFPKAENMGGGVSVKAGQELRRRWNADEIPVWLVQPQTVSHGLNLQYGTGHHIVLHSLMHDYDVYDQLIRRLRRQGSKQKQIFVHHIVARNTVDEVKLVNLRKKGKTQAGFLAALKEYGEERGKW